MSIVSFPIRTRFIGLSWLALGVAAIVAGCSPRTVSKPANTDSGLRAPLPNTNAFAGASKKPSTPYLSSLAKSGIPWQPWNQETINTAMACNRPMLVHIGYSTCPFSRRLDSRVLDTPELVEFFGKNFVCVLVDADDNIALANAFLDFLPMLGPPPSYPMLIWALPTGKPYMAHNFASMNGFMSESILKTATKALQIWQSSDGYATILADNAAARVAPSVQATKRPTPRTPAELFEQAYIVITRLYEAGQGTVSTNQNFPNANLLRMAMELAGVFPEDSFQRRQLIHIVSDCLVKMRDGAIRDPLAGTFHRYSEKPNWNGPHSEKILVDQAMIAMAYLDAARQWNDESFRKTAHGILDEVLKSWKTESGLFRHAETAFVPDDWTQPPPFLAPWFTWSLAEINRSLTPVEASVITCIHGMKPRGNMPPSLYSPAFKDNGNVLATITTPGQCATALDLPVAQVDAALASAHAKMRSARNARPGHFTDNRTTVAGNALLISAFSLAARQPGGEKYRVAALDLKTHLCNLAVLDNSLIAASGWWQDRPLPSPPTLPDYALLIQAILDVHEIAPGPDNLLQLDSLLQATNATFWDNDVGIYRMGTPRIALSVEQNPFPFGDTATPSANAVFAGNLRRLHALPRPIGGTDNRASLIQYFLNLRNPALTGYVMTAEIARDNKIPVKQ